MQNLILSNFYLGQIDCITLKINFWTWKMRQEFLDRLQAILREKAGGGWKDGWVYGRLKQEFALQQDELEEMARRLGFKMGWNAPLESLLEEQWEREKRAEKTLNRVRQDEVKRNLAAKEVQDITNALHRNSQEKRDFSDVEMALFLLICNINTDEQRNLLGELAKRYKTNTDTDIYF
jgi:hypothetical protein